MLGEGVGAGAVLALIREGRVTTRNGLAEHTGMSRSTLAQRVQSLLGLGLVQETFDMASTRGRPPATLAFNPTAGVVLAAALDATIGRVAVCDLAARPLAERELELDTAQPPDVVLAALSAALDDVLERADATAEPLFGVGVGVPGAVDRRGEPVSAPLMPGWDGVPLAIRLARRHAAPTLVERHVNVMALGEQWTHWRSVDHLLYLSAGESIDCGIVSRGAIHRGARGAAGHIGHIRLPGHDGLPCVCGNTGCLEAVAGGAAVAARLTAAGLPARSCADVVALVRSGSSEAADAVRSAGRAIGEVLAECIAFFDPGAVVVGGPLADVSPHLLAGARESATARSLPSGPPTLTSARLGARAGVVGAAVVAIEHALAPAAVDRAAHRTHAQAPT